MNYKISHTLRSEPSISALKLLLENDGLTNELVVVKDNLDGRKIRDALFELLKVEEVENLLEIEKYAIFPIWFPSIELSNFGDLKGDVLNISERILARHQLQSRLQNKLPSIFIITAASLLEKLEANDSFTNRKIKLSEGDKISSDYLFEQLDFLGYSFVPRVAEVGQFSRRGGIFDVFSPLRRSPIRIEIAEEVILSIRLFDLESQRSIGPIDNKNHDIGKDLIISSCTENYLEYPKMDFIFNKVLSLFKAQVNELNVSSSAARLVEEKLKEGILSAGSESLLSHFREGVSILDFMPNKKGSLIGVDNLEDLLVKLSEVIRRDYSHSIEHGNIVGEFKNTIFEAKEIVEKIENQKLINYEVLESEENLIESLEIKGISSNKSDVGIISKLVNRVLDYQKNKLKIILAIESDQRRKIIKDSLINNNIPFREADSIYHELLVNGEIDFKNIHLIKQNFPCGFIIWKKGVVFITEAEIFHAPSVGYRRLPYKRSSFKSVISTLGQLSLGDIVVHDAYGIGKFHGLKLINRAEGKGEFLEIEYSGGSKLYVPIYDFQRVGKYQSADAIPPALTALGSGKWDALKQKVRNEIANLTANLLKTHAMRSLVKGFKFTKNIEEEDLFANSFQYVETQDQLKAINDVLQDMESDKPMDRLVCGDVGYGKTEVAIRAAYKAVISGKQVAIVVPTTLLADQHFKTFSDRFSEFGLSVALVNRFRTKQEIRDSLADLASGKVDIIIGTHRLLQKDIVFKDLGLLVIDEEHKFGVAQKELLKKYRVEVDVLTLSATPIPRTLQQALHGTRELSVIDTAPFGRRPVSIRVDQFSKSLLLEALDRELSRGGQVYIVQHLIAGLHDVLDLVKELRPDIRVELAHGKMKGEEIEAIMRRFYSGDTKVLVSTAIVDSGLDVPNANTMVVLDPQDFGLAQLYQLRGRVGRGDKLAMAYFLYQKFGELTDDAKRRLAVMESQSTSGSGFKLALQDMEIRGAGSLFGKDQSGHAQVLGYEMYFKILEEAVCVEKKRRGMISQDQMKEEIIVTDPDLNLGIDLIITEDLIPDLQERLIFYQRTLDIDTIDKLADYEEEFVDRFGAINEDVKNLFKYMLIRSYCSKLCIAKMNYRDEEVSFQLSIKTPRLIIEKVVSNKYIKNNQQSYHFMSINLDSIINVLDSI